MNRLNRMTTFADLNLLDRLAGQVFEDFLPRAAAAPTTGQARGFEVEPTEKGLEIRAEVPGLGEEDLTIELEKGVLTIRGERKEPEIQGRAHRRERRFGTFERKLAIGEELDGEATTAELKDGLLTLFIPRRPETKPLAIKINPGA